MQALIIIACLWLGPQATPAPVEVYAGAILGIGYDIRLGKNFSLTPYLNGVGASFDGDGLNVSQIGIGFSWH